jgi:hypothetical protein
VARLAATLDGFINDPDAVFEAKFMLPWSFSEEAAAEKAHGPAPTQNVGHQRPLRRALDHHRRRQMAESCVRRGRAPRPALFALAALLAHCRATD